MIIRSPQFIVQVALALILATACGQHALGGPAQEIDFTPLRGFFELDGVRMPQVIFAGTGGNVTWSPPKGWQVARDGARAMLRPPTGMQASGAIGSFPDKPPTTADRVNQEVFVKRALATLPAFAVQPSMEQVEYNPLRMSGRATVEVMLSYSANSFRYTSSVLFVPRETDCIVIEFCSRQQDFEILHRQLVGSLHSAQGL